MASLWEAAAAQSPQCVAYTLWSHWLYPNIVNMVVMLPKLINRPAEMLGNARNENDVNSISRFEQATSVPTAAAHLCQYISYQPTVKLFLSRQDWTVRCTATATFVLTLIGSTRQRTDLESSSMKDFIVHRERRVRLGPFLVWLSRLSFPLLCFSFPEVAPRKPSVAAEGIMR